MVLPHHLVTFRDQLWLLFMIPNIFRCPQTLCDVLLFDFSEPGGLLHLFEVGFVPWEVGPAGRTSALGTAGVLPGS